MLEHGPNREGRKINTQTPLTSATVKIKVLCFPSLVI